jgi:hypothetical protein
MLTNEQKYKIAEIMVEKYRKYSAISNDMIYREINKNIKESHRLDKRDYNKIRNIFYVFKKYETDEEVLTYLKEQDKLASLSPVNNESVLYEYAELESEGLNSNLLDINLTRLVK